MNTCQSEGFGHSSYDDQIFKICHFRDQALLRAKFDIGLVNYHQRVSLKVSQDGEYVSVIKTVSSRIIGVADEYQLDVVMGSID
jgi:hypothetical protein